MRTESQKLQPRVVGKSPLHSTRVAGNIQIFNGSLTRDVIYLVQREMQ